jgi:hypothetical protein
MPPAHPLGSCHTDTCRPLGGGRISISGCGPYLNRGRDALSGMHTRTGPSGARPSGPRLGWLLCPAILTGLLIFALLASAARPARSVAAGSAGTCSITYGGSAAKDLGCSVDAAGELTDSFQAVTPATQLTCSAGKPCTPVTCDADRCIVPIPVEACLIAAPTVCAEATFDLFTVPVGPTPPPVSSPILTAGPVITLEPTQGRPGTDVEVKGSGFAVTSVTTSPPTSPQTSTSSRATGSAAATGTPPASASSLRPSPTTDVPPATPAPSVGIAPFVSAPAASKKPGPTRSPVATDASSSVAVAPVSYMVLSRTGGALLAVAAVAALAAGGSLLRRRSAGGPPGGPPPPAAHVHARVRGSYPPPSVIRNSARRRTRTVRIEVRRSPGRPRIREIHR